MPLPAVVVSFLKMARLSKRIVLTYTLCIITIFVIACIVLQEQSSASWTPGNFWRFCLFCDNETNLYGNQLLEKWEILPQTWLPRQTTVTTSVNYYKTHYWPHFLFLVALIIGNMQISNSEAHFQSFHQSNITPGGQNFVKEKKFVMKFEWISYQ